MNDFLKSLSDKLSAYQLFNFIYPGAVYLGILHFYGMSLGILNEIWWFLLTSYFLGMTISRFGSIVIESICLKFKWIEKYDIKKYAKCLNDDSFTGILLELTTFTELFVLWELCCCLLLFSNTNKQTSVG